MAFFVPHAVKMTQIPLKPLQVNPCLPSVARCAMKRVIGNKHTVMKKTNALNPTNLSIGTDSSKNI